MARQADFYPLVLPAVLGCPYMTADMAINRAAIELCSQARVWEESMDSIALQAGIEAYEIDPPPHSVLVCVRNVRLNGRPFPILVESWAELHGNADAAPGMPTHFAMRGNELVVYPLPAPEAAGARVTLAATLKPTHTATALPDVLLASHMDTVAEGAKGFLKEMTGTAWFDPSGAAYANQRFREGIARARINVEHGFVASSLSVTPRRFG